jgi:hypothetical protein
MRLRLLSLCLCAAAFLCLAAPARAEDDSVEFFSDVHIAPGKPVQNAVCFFCSIDVESKVNGNLVTFFSDVHVGSDVHRNMVNFFSSVTARPNVSIRQNAVNFFSDVQLKDGVHVGENVVAMFGVTEISPAATVSGNRVLFPFWLFGGPMMLLGPMIYYIMRELKYRRYRDWLRQQPLPPGM